jgi:hypothetical protein
MVGFSVHAAANTDTMPQTLQSVEQLKHITGTLCSFPSAMPPWLVKSLDSSAATLPPAAEISAFSPCPLSFSAFSRPVTGYTIMVISSSIAPFCKE